MTTEQVDFLKLHILLKVRTNFGKTSQKLMCSDVTTTHRSHFVVGQCIKITWNLCEICKISKYINKYYSILYSQATTYVTSCGGERLSLCISVEDHIWYIRLTYCSSYDIGKYGAHTLNSEAQTGKNAIWCDF